jgi:hypothetical protein
MFLEPLRLRLEMQGWYFEGVCTSMDVARTYIGIVQPTSGPASVGASYEFTSGKVLSSNGAYYNNGTAIVAGNFTSYAENDVVMVAYKNGKLWFGNQPTSDNAHLPTQPHLDSRHLSQRTYLSQLWCRGMITLILCCGRVTTQIHELLLVLVFSLTGCG